MIHNQSPEQLSNHNKNAIGARNFRKMINNPSVTQKSCEAFDTGRHPSVRIYHSLKILRPSDITEFQVSLRMFTH